MGKMKVITGILIVIALFGLPAGVQAEGVDDGLVEQWHFDGGSGGVLADSSGNGDDGAIHGATWVEGKYGAKPFMMPKRTNQGGNDEAYRISQ